MGNWLLKTEAVLLDGIEFYNHPNEDYARIDVLVGVEYSGFRGTTVSLEFADRHLFDYDEALASAPDGVQEDTFQSVLRYTREFRSDTLTLTLLASVFGPGGAVLYRSGDLPEMRRTGDNDRLFLEVKRHF